MPNAAVAYALPVRSKYAHEVYAVRPIAKGEEITFSYDTFYYFQTTEIRGSAGNLSFVCDCPACDVNDPFHYVSDMRRALLRRIYYLLNGIDAPGCAGRKIPVTPEADEEKMTPAKWKSLTFKHAERCVKWHALAWYLAEAESLTIIASTVFKNTVLLTLRMLAADRKDATMLEICCIIEQPRV